MGAETCAGVTTGTGEQEPAASAGPDTAQTPQPGGAQAGAGDAREPGTPQQVRARHSVLAHETHCRGLGKALTTQQAAGFSEADRL